MQNQWDYLLTHYAPDVLYVVGEAERAYDTQRFRKARWEPSLTFARGLRQPRILIAPLDGRYIKGQHPLPTFSHPHNALYIFGPDNGNLSEDDFIGWIPDARVYIPTETHHEMYAVTAATCVLYDRTVKHG